MSDPIVTLWTAQHTDARAPSPAELTERARVLRRRVWRRDATEYAAGALAAGVFGWMGLASPDWGVRIACLVQIAGLLVVMRNLWTRRPVDDPAALDRDALSHLRALLTAQRDALASVGRWYIGPMLPGMILFLGAVSRVTATNTGWGPALIVAALAAAIVCGVLYGVLRLNRHAARTLDDQIAALAPDSADTDPSQA
ncbi:MAG: hypothetical protein KYX69_06005 [Sphingomonas sp.]|uniref:hypothetical protein n=1 Tax=Sphingomonas sp. TaxID=28214 RepID=UPI00260F797A|nr:hypothetical protein [Sphingomonas sp.]MDK2767257.1 hypothetical protein [Sphingomonas sp.]